MILTYKPSSELTVDLDSVEKKKGLIFHFFFCYLVDVSGCFTCINWSMSSLMFDKNSVHEQVAWYFRFPCVLGEAVQEYHSSVTSDDDLIPEEEIREPFVEGNIVLPLCSCLLRKNYDVLVQACRALGNLCCDCDKAREALFQGRGLDNLMKLLEERLSVPEENAENQALWNAACGCLMNLTYDRCKSHCSLQAQTFGF
nr:uncharacterized protein LOC129281434 [Lytechinus pictus]